MFIQLRRGNDWGKQYFAVYPLREGGICTHTRGIADLEDGTEVRIMWPDNTEETVSIKNEIQQYNVSDHGKHDIIYCTLPGFVDTTHGVENWIPLDSVSILEDDIKRSDEDTYNKWNK